MAKAEEESWSEWSQMQEQAREINQGDRWAQGIKSEGVSGGTVRGFGGERRTRKKELGREESKRKRRMEEGSNVDTCCRPVGKRLRSSSCRCFDIDSDQEGCKAVAS